jgi:hypothetical protein
MGRKNRKRSKPDFNGLQPSRDNEEKLIDETP